VHEILLLNQNQRSFLNRKLGLADRQNVTLCILPLDLNSGLGYAAEFKIFLSVALFCYYRGADKFLARPGRKQTTATEDFDVHISYLLS